MTIGKEVYARKIYTGVGSPSMNEGMVRRHAYINDDINDTFGTCNFGTANNFNNFYQPVVMDTTSSSTYKTDEGMSASLKNNAPIKNNTLLTGKPVRLSFQLMTRAEPAELVIATIRSLLTIKAADDEILIVDNNHNDTSLYEPLAEFCAGLEAPLNVHFYHIDAVAGFKAGALNLALGLMDPSCTHVVVVDSDYQALPQARTSIAAAIQRYPAHALLQFPQFYRDAGRIDVHSELNHYFNHHLYRPFNRNRALSTGTFAVIRRAALRHLGGWSGASITEDAQMGVLMHQQGLHSQFIPEVIATGLLPTTLGDLMTQRRRWIYGNMQVLNTYFSIRLPAVSRRPLSGDDAAINDDNIQESMTSLETSSVVLSQSSRIGERLAYMRAHLSQLSAWVNFTGIFILLHVCSLLIITGALLIQPNINLSSLLTPLYVVYASYALFLARRLWAYCHDSAPLNQQVNSASASNTSAPNMSHSSRSYPSVSKKLCAWALHLNFWELGALSWVPVLWGRDKPFICTPKLEHNRTRRTVWVANIAALPKLLLVLNMITAVVVAPFSPLYSPLLFACALAICALKLWSAKVILANFAYAKPRAATATAKTISLSKVGNKGVSIIKKPLTATFKDEKAVNS